MASVGMENPANQVIIAITITEPVPLATLVKIIRPITGQSIADIKSCVENKSPIFEHELFLNDFAEVADQIRELTAAMNAAGIGYEILETGEPTELETLLNMMVDSEKYRL